MNKYSKKKKEQLRMTQGRASHILKKNIMFMLLKELGKNFCFQCGAEIEIVEELSIEHKVPWLNSDDPIELFFDLDNIAFSHLTCNLRAARRGGELIGEEGRKNMKRARLLRVKKVRDINNGAIYDTIEEAALAVGTSACNLGKYINGKMKSSKFKFEFVNE